MADEVLGLVRNGVGIPDADLRYGRIDIAPVILTTSTTLSSSTQFAKQTVSGITTTLWASPGTPSRVTIRNRSGGPNTINGNGNNIEGFSTATIPNGASFDLIYDGTEWTI